MDNKGPASTLLGFAELDFEDGKKYTLGRVATLGRAPNSDVVLNLSSVSRNHARIFLEGGHYWVKDLDSANGTTINGKKIKIQILSNEDKIAFGDAKAVFRTGTQQAAPAPTSVTVGGAETIPQAVRPTQTVGSQSPESLDAENQRLRKLVAQLERALAEANIRLRNLQERLK